MFSVSNVQLFETDMMSSREEILHYVDLMDDYPFKRTMMISLITLKDLEY